MDKQRQNAVFHAWMSEHRGVVFRIARSFAASAGDVEDWVQEILLATWRSVPLFEGQCKASTWIYRVALNRALTLKRSEKTRENQREALPADDLLRDATRQPRDERLEALYAGIRQLDGIGRALVLLQLDGFGYEEIAELTGLTPSNVGVRLHRCRARLRELLKEK